MSRAFAVLTVAAVLAAACSVDEPALVDTPQAVAALDQVASPDPTPTPLPTPTPVAVEAAPVTLRLAVEGEPEFDPVAADVVDPQDMVTVDLVHDGLTAWDSDQAGWVHSLARSFEPSADGLQWRVRLADRAFSDGTPITAEDVVRSFDRVRAQPLSIAAARFEVVAGYEAVADDTVLFTLIEPFAQLPALLSSPVYGIVPEGPLDGMIGSGPMRLVDGRLVAVDDAAEVDIVELVPVADVGEAHAAGLVDLGFVEGDTAASLAVPGTIEAHYALNVGAPELSDVDVRRTVVGVIGRSVIAEAGFGPSATAIDRMLPESLACAAPCGGDDPVDPVDVEPLSVVYVEEPTGREAAMAAAVVAELEGAGLEAAAAAHDLDTFVRLVSAGDYHIARTGWVGLFPSADSQLAPYLSDSPDNISGFADDRYDALIRDARAGGPGDPYDDARALLHEQAVVVPVARLQVRVILSERVRALVVRHDGTFDPGSLVIAD